MAIAAATAAAQLRHLARWTWLAMAVLAPLTLWWPSLTGWAAALTATLGLWVLWLCWRTAAGRRDVPTHWLHPALLGVLGLLLWHVSRSALGDMRGAVLSAGGRLDVSYLLHAALLALWLMLCLDLVGPRPLSGWIGAVVGLATVGGAAAGLLLGADHGRPMLACMGWTGAALLAAPRGGTAAGRLRLATAAVAAAAIGAFEPGAWPALALAAGAGGLSHALLSRRAGRVRAIEGVAGLALLAAAVSAATGSAWWGDIPAAGGAAQWIGRGERALGDVRNWDPGWLFLVGTIGWGGLAWAGGWLAIGTAAALARARRATQGGGAGPGAPLGGALAVAAAVAATAGLLAPGGLFCPAVNVLFGFAWAALPGMLSGAPPRRSGWWALAVVGVLAAISGLARHAGLLVWTAKLYGLDDVALHVAAGWLATQVLLWLLGRRWYLAAASVALSLAAAGAAEIAQRLYSIRSEQWSDFWAHAVGTAVAGLLWALCRAGAPAGLRGVAVKPPGANADAIDMRDPAG